MARLLMRIYAGIGLAVTVVGLGAMLVMPPASTRLDADGVPYFTPKVINPADGKAVDMRVLIRNYRGD